MAYASIPALQVLVSALVALVVVSLTHAFTSYRDRQNRRREQRINYLVNVYRAFSKANMHPKLYEVAGELEQAVADVQLFGTPKQVRLVRQFARDLGTEQSAQINDLLVELRESLRAELGAAPIPRDNVWLRVKRKEDGHDDHSLT